MAKNQVPINPSTSDQSNAVSAVSENVSYPQIMSGSIGTAPEFKPGEDWNLMFI